MGCLDQAHVADFLPLQTVVTIMLGVGVAERTGMLSAAIRLALGRAPAWLPTYASTVETRALGLDPCGLLGQGRDHQRAAVSTRRSRVHAYCW
jgi:AbgT putative transporter family